MGVCYQVGTTQGMTTGIYIPNNTTTIQAYRITTNTGMYVGTFTYPTD